MTVEEFWLLERKPGWKFEYWEGAAHIAPWPVIAPLILALAPRAGGAPLPIEPVQPADAPALISAFLEAFTGTEEYFDWPEDAVERSARECIESFFSAKRGEPMSASRLARDRGEIAGAALVVKARRGPHLDLLMVRAAWRRRGLATALVSAAVNDLCAAGETSLTSGYNLVNEASIAWHLRFGFAEEPDPYVAHVRAAYARLEISRLREIGKLDAETERRLKEEAERWEEMAKGL